MEDVDAKFVKLSKVEADGWVDNEVKVVKKVLKKRIQSGLLLMSSSVNSTAQASCIHTQHSQSY